MACLDRYHKFSMQQCYAESKMLIPLPDADYVLQDYVGADLVLRLILMISASLFLGSCLFPWSSSFWLYMTRLVANKEAELVPTETQRDQSGMWFGTPRSKQSSDIWLEASFWELGLHVKRATDTFRKMIRAWCVAWNKKVSSMSWSLAQKLEIYVQSWKQNGFSGPDWLFILRNARSRTFIISEVLTSQKWPCPQQRSSHYQLPREFLT
jgi:hypothetical protein